MSYFRINMLNVFIAFLLFCTANCKKEDFSNLSDLFDNPNLLNEIEKRLGILDEDRTAPPKVGCYALSGTFESGCRYKSNSSKIIKTTESLSRGAKYLEEYTNVSCPQECSARCCDHPNCDTAVFRNKSDHNCYLFQCGEPSMCVFVHHDDYWMTSVSIDDHNSHSFSPGGGTVSHENELENLGAGAGPGAGSGEQSQATSEPARPTTTTSEPATTHIPRLGESCPSYETQCDDPHAECLLKQCQCRGGYHPLNGICRKRCQMDEFQCELIVHGPMMRDCIPAVYTCDGIKQCINGSDEKDCPSPQQSPEDSVNSDKRPFLDNPSKQDPGSDRHPSVGTGSSPDGTQSSDRNTGIHRKPAKEDPESKQEPAQPDVIPPVRKTTVAPVKVSTTTKVEEPKKPTEKPKEIAEIPDTAPDMADQASVDSDSSSSESEETQSNPDKTDDQFTESKNRSKSDSIEVMFLDKNTVVESYSDNNQGPIVALALGLGITLVMLIFVGCRLRNVKRRLRKGRALHSNEADYLINGMYL